MGWNARLTCGAIVAMGLLQPLAAAEPVLLWQIGARDDRHGEFALAPGEFGAYAGDAVYVVGRSSPDKDWPYVHPGPADWWAGDTEHVFTIYFALAERPVAECRLIVDLQDTHTLRPPLLRIAVNDVSWEQPCPPGGTEGSIQGDVPGAREHVIEIPVRSDTLRAGLNRVTITNAQLSWVIYDWVGFYGPQDARLTEPPVAAIEGISVSPWTSRSGGRLTQEVSAKVVVLGPTTDLELRASGTQPVRVPEGVGLRTVPLVLPGVTAQRPLRVELLSDGRIISTARGWRGPAPLREPVDYVDCLIGTGTSRWMLYPGPCLPFGMVKLSPDNQEQGWKAGYEYTISSIAGFSHIHSWTMAGLLTMPTVGPLQIEPGSESDPDAGYRSRFSHDTEIATPGYYAVTLEDYGIRAELTTTVRAGMQRYTFPKAADSRILFDLLFPAEYGYDVVDARITQINSTEIEGYSVHRGRAGAEWNDYTVHFVARTSRPFKSMGAWVNGKVWTGVTEVAGCGDVGCFVAFDTTEGEEILLQTGISLVSVEQARLNLTTEMGPFGWDFDAVRANARQVWADLLGAIEVEGGREVDRVKFYTNLYRSYCSRTIWSDVNGQYVDMYEQVQTLPDPDSPVYGCDAFWNTFWNLNQLWVLAHPDIALKWVRSLLEIEARGGWLPKGPEGIEYSDIMVASHEIALIVAAYQAGLRDFDVAQAYRACRHTQTTPGGPHPGGGGEGNHQLGPYMELGYVPVEAGPVSNTLEYAYDDWCVAQFAKALGHTRDYQYFLNRSRNYRNVFDPLVGYVRQRHADGRWVSGFSPFDGAGFVEGNAWQFTWFAPHDVAGLIELLGRDTFVSRLDAGLTASEPNRFNATGDRMADFPINHGNQPNMQSSWLFNYAGAPWLTQKWTRKILDLYYGSSPIDGYPGDEDQGQMGAWFVMSAMGLFQMDGGCAVRPTYGLASPLFDRVTIHLDDRYYRGDEFVIEAHRPCPEANYIQSATLDGRALGGPWLYQSELVDGGKLVLTMGTEPNTMWGSAPHVAPPCFDY